MHWKLKKLSNLYGLHLSRVLNRPLVKPNTITITLTSRCNLRCIMCDHWKSKNKDELSLEEIKNIIDQISDWGIKGIDLSGGEPFMRKDIFDIIQYATSKKIAMNITTNATLLNKKEIEKIINSSVRRIQISLDGTKAETHDLIRGVEGTFNKVIKTIDYFDELKNKKDIKLNITTVIMKQNLTELLEIIELAKKLNLNSITFQPVVDDNLDIRRRNALNPLRIPDSKSGLMDKVINDIIKIRKRDPFVGNSIQHLESMKRYFRNKPLKEVKCYAGFIFGIVAPNGRLWSCMGDFGNLYKETIKEAWFSKEAGEKRKMIKKCKTPCLYPCYLNPDEGSIIKATINNLK